MGLGSYRLYCHGNLLILLQPRKVKGRSISSPQKNRYTSEWDMIRELPLPSNEPERGQDETRHPRPKAFTQENTHALPRPDAICNQYLLLCTANLATELACPRWFLIGLLSTSESLPCRLNRTNEGLRLVQAL